MISLARAAALAALALGAVSCGESPEEAVDFTGSWQGYLVDPRFRPEVVLSVTTLQLQQAGDVVTGTVGSEASLLGKAQRSGLSFTLVYGSTWCAQTGAGTGWVEQLGDRDRLHLGYAVTGNCGLPPSVEGQFDRMRCPASAAVCWGSSPTVPAYCADVATDPANCGYCGHRCDVAQRCASGYCAVP